MGKTRLEAFSDGVFAIIITIMVLELRVPHGEELDALAPLWPMFLSYVLSFVHIGIYWNNHHHMLHTLTRVNGSILWANMHLLFWLSLLPFGTAWMGENHFERMPSALYGMVLLLAAMAYLLLQRTIIASQGKASLLKRAVGRDWKGTLPPALYIVGIVASLWIKWAGPAMYALVALIWLIPDRRISRELERSEAHS